MAASLAGFALLSACATAPGRQESPRPETPRAQSEPPAPIAAVNEREVRYFKDEQGRVWNDRGVKQPSAP
jgi:hypothetical protein